MYNTLMYNTSLVVAYAAAYYHETVSHLKQATVVVIADTWLVFEMTTWTTANLITL